MCFNCFGWPRDYASKLEEMSKDKYAEAMTDKEKNDLKLFKSIRINEEILRRKIEFQDRLMELHTMKKEYDI